MGEIANHLYLNRFSTFLCENIRITVRSLPRTQITVGYIADSGEKPRSCCGKKRGRMKASEMVNMKYERFSHPPAIMSLFKTISNVIAEMVEFALELLGLEDVRELNEEIVMITINNDLVRVKYKDITII